MREGPLQHKFVSKGWGSELWIVNNDLYCGKVLRFLEGKKCSFHYHVEKTETMLIAEGRIGMRYGWDHDPAKASFIVLERGDSFHIPPNLVHQMEALGGNATIYEFSTHHKDEDSFRVVKGD